MVPGIKAAVTPQTGREFPAMTPGTAIASRAANPLPAAAHARVLVTGGLLGTFPVAVTC